MCNSISDKIKAFIHWNKAKGWTLTAPQPTRLTQSTQRATVLIIFQEREFFKGLWNFIVFPIDPLMCGASVCEILCNVHICLTARRQWGVAVKFIGSILSASVTIWHRLDNNRVNTHYIGLELRGCIWGICTGTFEESYKTAFTAWFHDWQIVMDQCEVIILSSNSSDQAHQCTVYKYDA